MIIEGIRGGQIGEGGSRGGEGVDVFVEGLVWIWGVGKVVEGW